MAMEDMVQVFYKFGVNSNCQFATRALFHPAVLSSGLRTQWVERMVCTWTNHRMARTHEADVNMVNRIMCCSPGVIAVVFVSRRMLRLHRGEERAQQGLRCVLTEWLAHTESSFYFKEMV